MLEGCILLLELHVRMWAKYFLSATLNNFSSTTSKRAVLMRQPSFGSFDTKSLPMKPVVSAVEGMWSDTK